MDGEPIITNRFDKYFAPLSLGCYSVSWVEPGICRVMVPRGLCAPAAWSSISVGLLGLGTTTPEIGIPSTLLRATYNFKFRILPEERIAEDLSTHIFYYGQGWSHAEYWGTVSWPLFRVYLSAKDNHLYLTFDGGKQVTWGSGGYRNTYPFVSWTADLGHVDEFTDWSDFVIWLDLENKCFKKILVRGVEVPFPPGYDAVTPADFYQGALYNGMLIGCLTKSNVTNVSFDVDDVEVWPEYHTPKPPPTPQPTPQQPVQLCMQQIVKGILLVSTVAIPLAAVTYKTWKERLRE